MKTTLRHLPYSTARASGVVRHYSSWAEPSRPRLRQGGELQGSRAAGWKWLTNVLFAR